MAKKGQLISKRRTVMSGGKEYSYKTGKAREESPLLFTRRGDKYYLKEDVWNDFIDSIWSRAEEGSMDVSEAVDVISALEAEKEKVLKGEHIYESEQQHGYNRIDVDSMLSRIEESKTRRMIRNLGFSEAEFADTLNKKLGITSITDAITEADISDAIWGQITDRNSEYYGEYTVTVKGHTWIYTFKYNADVLGAMIR